MIKYLVNPANWLAFVPTTDLYGRGDRNKSDEWCKCGFITFNIVSAILNNNLACCKLIYIHSAPVYVFTGVMLLCICYTFSALYCKFPAASSVDQCNFHPRLGWNDNLFLKKKTVQSTLGFVVQNN